MKVVEIKKFKKKMDNYFESVPIILADNGQVKYILTDKLEEGLCFNCGKMLSVDEYIPTVSSSVSPSTTEVKQDQPVTVTPTAIWHKCDFSSLQPGSSCYEEISDRYRLMNNREVFLCKHHFDVCQSRGIYVEKL